MPSRRSSSVDEPTPDPLMREEIENTAAPANSNQPINTASQKRTNAFAELMSSKKPKATAPEQPPKPAVRGFNARDGLGVYIAHPEANPEGLIVEYDDDFVVITDKFPKASVHLLLIPRTPAYYTEHPLELLSTDAAFLTEVRRRVVHLRDLAASELRRKYGRYSAADAPYQQALEAVMASADPPAPEHRDSILPPGRDWLADIKVGVHTHPSMNHMHIHVMSRDMHSPCMKHKKHYLSFNSSFFVSIDDFPLEKGSERFHPGNWPNWDMQCWRCGQNFGNKFAALKRHVEDEFEQWKKE